MTIFKYCSPLHVSSTSLNVIRRNVLSDLAFNFYVQVHARRIKNIKDNCDLLHCNSEIFPHNFKFESCNFDFFLRIVSYEFRIVRYCNCKIIVSLFFPQHWTLKLYLTNLRKEVRIARKKSHLPNIPYRN